MAGELAYYTTKEVAERAGVDASTVRLWVLKGRIKSKTTLGGHHRFEQQVIDDLFPEEVSA